MCMIDMMVGDGGVSEGRIQDCRSDQTERLTLLLFISSPSLFHLFPGYIAIGLR